MLKTHEMHENYLLKMWYLFESTQVSDKLGLWHLNTLMRFYFVGEAEAVSAEMKYLGLKKTGNNSVKIFTYCCL